MRPLSATRFVEETGPQTWKATLITAAMATEEIAAGHRMMLAQYPEDPYLCNN
jgi:hypothetical protein